MWHMNALPSLARQAITTLQSVRILLLKQVKTFWHGRSRKSFAIETPILIARQADLHESLEFPIRANHPIRANRANRFARITPLRLRQKNPQTWMLVA